jgi:hypothetical protein
MALHGLGNKYRTQIDRGLAFMQEQAGLWDELQVDAFTVGLEMILPKLIEEANDIGLKIDPLPYTSLNRFRQKKLAFLSRISPYRGDASLYSWEAWGNSAEVSFVDPVGGIGHNPAATAAWLIKAAASDHLINERHWCCGMLQNAARSTRLGLPNVYPSFWPLEGFELSYGLFVIIEAGLTYVDGIHSHMCRQAENLYTMFNRKNGIGFGAEFINDADDTATALTTLTSLGYKMKPDHLKAFERGGHYFTYPFEANASPLTNAHAIYALSVMGESTIHIESYLSTRQAPSGYWPADKWHTSWVYTTAEAIMALMRAGNHTGAQRAVNFLFDQQRPDCGWGQNGSTRAETAYALLALRSVGNHAATALDRGYQYLRRHYKPHDMPVDRLWISKEIYTPYRIDRIYELCALISITLDQVNQ